MSLTFLKKQKEQENVYSFFFAPPPKFSWQAGQYLHYELPHPDPDDRGIGRWFTISAAPFEKNVRLTTRFDPKRSSTFKKALLNLEPGTQVETGEPRGDFVYPASNEVTGGVSRVVFIAGGIGITPYHSILLQLDHEGKELNVDLLWANRDDKFVFGDEMEKLAAKHPEFKLKKFIDKRIQAEDLKKYLEIEDERGATQLDARQGAGEERTEAYTKYGEGVPQPATPSGASSTSGATSLAGWQAGALRETIFYLSGPKPMVETYQKSLEALGVYGDRVKLDYFPGY